MIADAGKKISGVVAQIETWPVSAALATIDYGYQKRLHLPMSSLKFTCTNGSKGSRCGSTGSSSGVGAQLNWARKRVGLKPICDTPIESSRMLEPLFHLSLRSTRGFLSPIFEMIALELPVPD